MLRAADVGGTLVARTWGRRCPLVELLAAGGPQHALGRYEQGWAH
jgi:hypothetical protein